MEIKKIDIQSVIKVSAWIGFIIGIVSVLATIIMVTCFDILFGNFSSKANVPYERLMAEFDSSWGYLRFALLRIFDFVYQFVLFNIAGAWTYNLVAQKFGGIKIEISSSD